MMKVNGRMPHIPKGDHSGVKHGGRKKLDSCCGQSAMRKVDGWTQYTSKDTCTGVISGVKYVRDTKDGCCGDSLALSEKGRQLAMAKEMEKDGLSHEAAMGLVSGKLTMKEPDWDTFEIPMLEVQPDPSIYKKIYMEESLKNFKDILGRVKAHYAPGLARIKGMDTLDAMDYLYRTYKLPYQDKLYVPGTKLPARPEGMTKGEADMAYDQIRRMYFGLSPVLKDPYALGEDGMRDLDSMDDRARQKAQAAYDAAKKELSAQQEVQKAQRREELKKMTEKINSGTGLCLGYMALRVNDLQVDSEGEA